jgi:phage/plasmid-like protein (TIGR03299 family)
MAHELNVTHGKVSMFFYGEKPWHGLGQEAPEPVRTWEEMCDLAGLGYEIELQPQYLADGRRTGAFATVRKDTGQILGNRLSAGYRPIQNIESFNFLNSVAAESGIEFHTAGALGAGERVWLMARIPGNICLGDSGSGQRDEVERNLLLYNTHNGSKAMCCFWTPVRVVCANTVRAALLGRGGEGIVIRHTGEIVDKIQEAQRLLGLGVRYYEVIEPLLHRMAETRLSVAQARAYFTSLYPDPDKDGEKSRRGETLQVARSLMEQLFDGRGIGLDMPSIRHSVWAAYNAVTEYTDHFTAVYGKAPKSPRSDVGQAARLERMWFGDLAKEKQAAFEVACELIGADVPGVGSLSLN